MKKILLLLVFIPLLIGCNSKSSKIKKAMTSYDSNIESVKNIEILQVHYDTVHSPSYVGKTYKFKASVFYNNDTNNELEKFIFIADKDNWTKLGDSSNIE